MTSKSEMDNLNVTFNGLQHDSSCRDHKEIIGYTTDNIPLHSCQQKDGVTVTNYKAEELNHIPGCLDKDNNYRTPNGYYVHSCVITTGYIDDKVYVNPPESYDPVNHPKHYTSHPSGIECIEIVRHMSFNIGNAIKYLWRADDKGDPIENLEKSIWYIKDEIERRKKNAS